MINFPHPDPERLNAIDYSDYLSAFTSHMRLINPAPTLEQAESTLLTIDDEPIGKLDDLPLWAQFYIKHLWKQLTEKDKSK